MLSNKPTDTTAQLGRRVRRLRHRLDMTLQALSSASGVSVGYLSQVEKGNSTPTLGALSKIASALNVAIDYFVSTPTTVNRLTRKGGRAQFSLSGSSVKYEQLGSDFPGHELTSYILNVAPGYISEQIRHEGEELIYILEGAIVQVVDGKEYTMAPGDSLHYLGDSPHSWSNKTDTTARLSWVGRMHYERSGDLEKPELQSRSAPRAATETL